MSDQKVEPKTVLNKLKMLEYQKKYRTSHSDSIMKAQSEYKATHKEETQKYNKEYYQKTRTERLKKEAENRIRTECDCGGKYNSQNKLKHDRSKRHKKYLEKDKA
jgi:hypothetical protein